MDKKIFLLFSIITVTVMLAISGCHKDNEDTDVVSGTINGHDYVDLGLPSGTKWATCNIGATTPDGYGDYFAWGETNAKVTYNWETYEYYDSSIVQYNISDKKLNKYNDSDNLIVLETRDDVATVSWGANWRMPTQDELKELKNNCIVTNTMRNGVNGLLFTGSNGNSIFLPAAGYRNDSDVNGIDFALVAGYFGSYWSSSLFTDDQYCSWRLSFDYSAPDCYVTTYLRYSGFSVRPVCDSH